MAKGSSFSKTAIWILMGLLILGLGGFGAVNLSGNVRSIGTVGDKSIDVDTYARQLQQQIRAIEAETGEQLPFARAQEMGLDRAVLQRVVRDRTLDNEAAQLGLSIGDAAVRDELLKISAFQGIDGKFDREGYRFALQQSGMSETEFEASLRDEASRTLLQSAVVSGITMPDTFAETLLAYVGEQRSFTWVSLDQDDLANPLPTPTDEDLQTYYDEHADLFMLPASKQITYIWLSPEDLTDEIEVPEEELRTEYENRASDFNTPERRLVERLVFSDQAAADQAAAALEVSGTTFNALVEDRGLTLSDVDLGDVGRLELDAAGEAVFAAEVGDIVGPLPSSLGPALFRVNGVLPAQSTSFEDARPELLHTIGAARAVRAVETRAREIDDELAGGATLEQIDQETKATLGTIDWTEDTTDGIAAYAGFRQAAAALREDDFPKIEQLEDGGVFALRLDGALAERPNPFEDARADVLAAWQADKTVEMLSAQANAELAALGDGKTFDSIWPDARIEEGMTRSAFIEGTPDGLMEEVFKMTPGDISVQPGASSVAVVRLDHIDPTAKGEETTLMHDRLQAQLDQALAQDVFRIYSDQVVRRTAPVIDQRAVQAVHVNFP